MSSYRFVFLSDTHGRHCDIKSVPDGDFLIYCGDFTMSGKTSEVQIFMDWFISLPHKYKILVPGNHDMVLYEPMDRLYRRIRKYGKNNILMRQFSQIMHAKSVLHKYRHHFYFLVNSGIKIEGIHFYGHCHCNKSVKKWDTCDNSSHSIPIKTDVLITHVPPYGILDNNLGCKKLLRSVKKVKPYIHVFGHVHEHGGNMVVDNNNHTFFVNCSIMDEQYRVKNKPILHII